ncbi:MAG: hypothetical protein GW939_02285 [Candidatus Magasanikbacteria bacterium]|uniref:Uncharacterized protein n=1 Tax=Candidatus Magasanikbacteria bacterium CG10_big_fil_rev_8_21_14_0_10_38_6 TaxID=1974647 RepID=A0A2M6P1P5_9BACT|nr:hypothetical protein [Candidatus Magasanikbacteria bacterium]NCS72123.1 hypothetical protein [Candidatus Magasanikbacteria bacterium]PIR77621.1 MAG: hypothetical protein COU30_01445 [Candidatus Magasanikbacteria bacterium CG10_big_fil_rev_8_21_14_0_10_38_6]
MKEHDAGKKRFELDMIREQREQSRGSFHGDFMNKLNGLYTAATWDHPHFLKTCEDLSKKYNGKLIPTYEEYVQEVSGGDAKKISLLESTDETATKQLHELIDKINHAYTDTTLDETMFIALYNQINTLVNPPREKTE